MKYQIILADIHIRHKIDMMIPNVKPNLAMIGLSTSLDSEANIIDQQKNRIANIKKKPTNNFIKPPNT